MELIGIISRFETVDIFRGAEAASEDKLWSVNLLPLLLAFKAGRAALEAVESLRGREVTEVFLEASEAATLRSVKRLAWAVFSDDGVLLRVPTLLRTVV